VKASFQILKDRGYSTLFGNHESDNGDRHGNGNGNGNGNEENGSDNKRIKRMTVAKAMQPHVHELNPLLEECEINESQNIDTIPDEYFTKFDIIVASNIGLDSAIRISNAVKVNDNGNTSEGENSISKNTKFYLVHSFGYYACALMDLGEGHTFRKEIGKDKLSDVMTVKPYTSLESMSKTLLKDVKDRWHKNGPPVVYVKYRALLHYHAQKKVWPDGSSDDFVSVTKEFLKMQGLKDDYLGDDGDLKQLASTASAEVSPVCAVMGGVLGNEVIKAISSKGEPANNIMMFDGTDGGCRSFVLK